MWIYFWCLASILVISQCGIVKQVVVLLPEDSQTALYAARYAAHTINRDDSILPFYHLDLVEIDSGGCGEQNNGYNQLVKTISALKNPVGVAGILGPFCGQYPQTADNDLVLKITRNFGIYHISGSPWPSLVIESDSISLSLAPSNHALSSTVIHVIARLGWHRIGLIGSTYGLFSEINSHLINDMGSPVKIVSYFQLSSEFSVPSFIQELQENDVTIFLLSMPINLVYHVLCYTFKYQHHLAWPKYVWIVYGHWFDDLINEYQLSSSCNLTEIQLALEGVIFLNPHFELEEKNGIIVSGQTFNDYTTAVFSSNTTMSEQYRSNLAYDAVWTLALSLNQSTNRTIKLEFDGSSGKVNGRNMRKVAITHVSGGMPILVGFYDSESEHINVSLLDILPADSLPRVEVQHPLLVPQLMIAFSLEIFMILLTFLYFYFRKEPEIKATSPYLSILAFAGIYMVLTGIEVVTFASSGRKEYVTTPLCRSTIWFLGHGEALFLVTVLVRMVRIYRLFTYFGKTSRLWSDVVLFVIVTALVMVVTVISTLWTVFSPPTAVTQERVKDGQVLVETICEYPMINIWLSICLFYGFLLRVILVIIAVMTRKIRRQNFKDTKKINLFVFLSFILGSIFLFSPGYTRDRTWRVILEYMAFMSIAVSYVVILIIPKVWPPFKRRFYCKHTQVTKKSVSQQKS